MDNNLTMEHELYHHGIKGQRWGVRRYQNPDGSLTAAGKKKYGTKSNFEKVQAAKRSIAKAKEQAKRDKANARTQAEISKYRSKAAKKLGEGEDNVDVKTKNDKRKSMSDLSDDELKTKTDRLRLEKSYTDAQSDKIVSQNRLNDLTPKKQGLVSKLAKKTFNDVIVPTATKAGKEYLEKKLSEALGLNEDSMKSLAKEAKVAEYTKKIYEAKVIQRKYENDVKADAANENGSTTDSSQGKAAKKAAKKAATAAANAAKEASKETSKKEADDTTTYSQKPEQSSRSSMSTDTAYSMAKNYSDKSSSVLNTKEASSVIYNDVMKSVNSGKVNFGTKLSSINSNYSSSSNVNSLIKNNSDVSVKDLMKNSGYNKYYDKTVKHSEEDEENELYLEKKLGY